ncbi:MAG TPA: Uma2 family endonuclease [Candidatus Hypogeohydataceae bacterium YC41]
MPTTTVKFTYQDYLHLPEDRRYELIEGELFMVPSLLTYHQEVSGNLDFIVREFVKKRGLGKVFSAPTDVVLSNEDVVQPDIFFIEKGRLGIIKEKNIQGAPDLIVEILSPSLRYRDKVHKKKLYQKYGVKEYWIVDPQKRQIEHLWLEEGGYRTIGIYGLEDTIESPMLKGLKVMLREVFL